MIDAGRWTLDAKYVLLCFDDLVDVSVHDNDEVDGGSTCDNGGDGNHYTGVLLLANWHPHLYAGHIDVVGQVKPVTGGLASLVAV